MSSAGHVLDMISRLKNNKRERKTMFDDKPLVYSGNQHKIKSKKKVKKLSRKLKREISTKQKHDRITEYRKIVLSFLIAIIIFVGIVLFILL